MSALAGRVRCVRQISCGEILGAVPHRAAPAAMQRDSEPTPTERDDDERLRRWQPLYVVGPRHITRIPTHALFFRAHVKHASIVLS